jgi:transcriptional regulator with GAF, ATPase, and Fis domain
MNTDVQIGNGMYFLVLSIVILSSAIFIVHILEESRENLHEAHEQNLPAENVENTLTQATGSFVSPFEVDLDLLAESIIPRIDLKERTEDYAERILLNMSKHFEIVQGVFFLKNQKTNLFESISTFAYTSDENPSSFKIGEGIPGQVAKNKTLMHLTSIPDGYLKIQSGLGKSFPTNLLIIPLLLNKETIGIIELASFHVFDHETVWTFKNLAKIIGNAVVTKVKAGDKK